MPQAVAAIIPAGGEGSRLVSATDEPAVPKALRSLAGRTLLQRSIDVLAPYVDEIVVAAPADAAESMRFHVPGVRVVVVPGGQTRQESVRNALDSLTESIEWVLVHDAARPLVPSDVVRRVLDALRAGARCVVPAVPPHDSLRWVGADGGNAPLDRSQARLVQTPQGFTFEALLRGHRSSLSDLATDDATLVEATGEVVTLVEGHALAFKITRPMDLMLADALLAAR
jgi:2-C-methyl-D-erythritol 4-phosphate cytidylyltransferase